ncbi:MAG: isoamylase early set domain-containing protein [Chloroflexota bacterium]
MLKKQAIQNGKVIKVTFETHRLPEADEVFLVGDFNDWNETADPMKKRKKDGCFTASLKLEPGREYQFRYLVDGEWHNDWDADKYVTNPFSGDNSVILT